MTEPVELLEQRLSEISAAREFVKKNKLPEDDLYKIDNMYNKYYVCIEIINKALIGL